MCRTQVTQVMFLVTCLNGADCYDPRETQTTTHLRSFTSYVLEPGSSLTDYIPRCISLQKNAWKT